MIVSLRIKMFGTKNLENRQKCQSQLLRIIDIPTPLYELPGSTIIKSTPFKCNCDNVLIQQNCCTNFFFHCTSKADSYTPMNLQNATNTHFVLARIPNLPLILSLKTQNNVVISMARNHSVHLQQ